MGHASMVTTQGYYKVRQERARKAVHTLAPLQIDRHGNRTMPVVQQQLESERLRREVGQIAVPLGLCTEPSNVKARGQGCVYRYRCVGREHFRTDPSNQAELREYLGREHWAAESFAYGDRPHDLTVLRWASEGFLVTPRAGLVRV